MGSLRGWPQTLPGRQEQGELAAPLRQSRQLIWELSSEAKLCTQLCSENLHRGQHRPGTSHGTSDVVLQVLWNSEILKQALMVIDGHWWSLMSHVPTWRKKYKNKEKHRGFEDLLQMHVKPTVDSTSAPWRRTEQDAQELKLPEKNCRIHQTTKYYTHCKTAISCSTYINSRSRWSNQ